MGCTRLHQRRRRRLLLLLLLLLHTCTCARALAHAHAHACAHTSDAPQESGKNGAEERGSPAHSRSSSPARSIRDEEEGLAAAAHAALRVPAAHGGSRLGTAGGRHAGAQAHSGSNGGSGDSSGGSGSSSVHSSFCSTLYDGDSGEDEGRPARIGTAANVAVLPQLRQTNGGVMPGAHGTVVCGYPWREALACFLCKHHVHECVAWPVPLERWELCGVLLAIPSANSTRVRACVYVCECVHVCMCVRVFGH